MPGLSSAQPQLGLPGAGCGLQLPEPRPWGAEQPLARLRTAGCGVCPAASPRRWCWGRGRAAPGAVQVLSWERGAALPRGSRTELLRESRAVRGGRRCLESRGDPRAFLLRKEGRSFFQAEKGFLSTSKFNACLESVILNDN